MGTPKSSKTPAKSGRASARKPKPNDKRATPVKPTTTTPTPRKRKRASDFIVRPSTSKKRATRASSPTNSQNSDDHTVDDLIRNVRGLINAGDPPAVNALEEAIRRADETFKNDISGSSSSEDERDSKLKKQSSNQSKLKTPKSSTVEKKKELDSIKKGKKSNKKSMSKSNAKSVSVNDKHNDEHEDVPNTDVKTSKKSTVKKLSTKRTQVNQKKRKSTDGPKVAKKLNLESESSDEDVTDLKKHKADIESLKKDDPDFYKFLEENEATLLDFDFYPDVEEESEDHSDEEQNPSSESEDDNDPRSEKVIGKEVTATAYGNNNEMREEGESSEGENFEEAPAAKSPARPLSVKKSEAVRSAQKLKKSSLSAKKPVLENKQSVRKQSPSNRKKTIDDVEPEVEEFDNDSYEDSETTESSEEEDTRMTYTAKHSQLKASPLSKTPVEVSSNSEDDDAEEDELAGYSDDEDTDEEMEESKAAAEAGLIEEHIAESEEEEEDQPLPTKESKLGGSMKFVDMQYLREIQEQLSQKRSSLKACKDLLRLFRAGREILPQQKSLTKKQKQTKRSSASKQGKTDMEHDDDDMDIDEFEDDYTFTSGKVKFASAKAYQQAMNMCVIGIQDALDRMLGKPQLKQAHETKENLKWNPRESKRWKNLEPIFRPFVYHMLELCDTVVDPKTLRFLLKRLEHLVPYTKENKHLLKKILRIATMVWSSDGQHVSEATRLRSYLLLNRLAHGEGNIEVVLRSCCNLYSSKIANVCNARTLPQIHFAVSCLVELFSIDMGASYTTCYSYLREMALSLRAVLVSKNGKEEIERIHNWSFVNKLRLWAKVLGKHGGKDELHPLIYPYVQISLGVMRVQPTPRTYPLRLHIASYLSDIVEDTGTFIPLVPQLLTLFRCSELRKKPVHGSSKALDWRSLLRVSDDVVKTKPFLSLIVNGVVVQIARYFSIMAKHVSFPELSHFTETSLRKVTKELRDAEWKTKLTSLTTKLHQTSELIESARAKADFSPNGAVSPEGMLAIVPGITVEQKMPIQKFYHVEKARVAKEDALRVARNDNDLGAAPSDETEISSDSEEDAEVTTKTTKRNKHVSAKGPKLLAPVNSDDEDHIATLDLDSDSSDEE